MEALALKVEATADVGERACVGVALLELAELGGEVVELLAGGDACVDDVDAVICGPGCGSRGQGSRPHGRGGGGSGFDTGDVEESLASSAAGLDGADDAGLCPLLEGATVHAQLLFGDARLDIPRWCALHARAARAACERTGSARIVSGERVRSVQARARCEVCREMCSIVYFS